MHNFSHLKEWLQLPDATKLNVFRETGRNFGLQAVAIEKDWWVVHTLAIIFSMDCAPYLLFKGGTSLSKGWNLIQRFSEDIDLALDREFLGFAGELSTRDIKNLRKASNKYITTQVIDKLKAKFAEAGFADVMVKVQDFESSGQDPLIIEIYYPKLTETDTYLKPGLLLEIGSRSLKEPFTQRTFSTMVAETFTDRSFIDNAITLPVVNPERTFLEKIFLLHEEFQKPEEKIRVERLSRHLYDIEKLMHAGIAKTALQNTELYNTIVDHRSKLTPIAGIDYSKHHTKSIQFLPPKALMPLWEADYKEMQVNMIYGKSLSFTELIKTLSELQSQINKI